jgi:hypothetical protein
MDSARQRKALSIFLRRMPPARRTFRPEANFHPKKRMLAAMTTEGEVGGSIGVDDPND